MKLRRRLAGIGLALVVGLSGAVVTPTPVYADHTNVYGHWGNGYAPNVWAGGSVADDSVMDAAYFWQDRGMRQGYQPPLPKRPAACSAGNGSIDVCAVPSGWGFLGTHQGATHILTAAHLGYADNNPAHIYRATVLVRETLTNPKRQMVFRHEFGHALGLGHTGVLSVMRWDAPVVNEHQHDRDAMWSMYSGHITG